MAARDAHGRLLLPALAALLGLPPLACSGGDQPEAAPEQGAPRAAESSGGDAATASSTIEGPVGLRSIDGKLGAPGDGRGHVLQISAEYEVGAELPKRSGLHAKVTCGEGESRVVDVVSLASYHADFREMKAGDHKQVQTAAFWLGGLSAAPDKCQLDVAYATGKKGEVERTEVGTWCWSADGTKQGACKDLPAARVPTGAALLADGFDVQAQAPTAGDGATSHGVSVRARVRFAATPEKVPNLTLRAACKVGERTYVDVAPHWPRVRPFDITPGEDLLVAAGMYKVHGLPAAAESCDVSVWQDTAWNQPDELAGRVCWDGSSLKDGACEERAAAEPEPLSTTTAALARPTLVVQDDARDPSLKLARFDFEVDVARASEKGTRLDVSAVCDGKEHKPTLVGPDLSRVGPGESVRLSLTAFVAQPLASAPERCTLKVTAKKLGGEDRVEVGEMCVAAGGEAKPGACE